MRDSQLQIAADRAQAESAESKALELATAPGSLLPLSSPRIGTGRNAAVLIAEDNASNRAFMEAVMRAMGIEVVAVSNGELAIEQLSKHHFDAVLMDCYMPRLDGVAATTRIRDLERRQGAVRVPIIALTAAAMPDDRQRCVDAGMDEFLLKPFNIDHLQQVMGRVLTGFKLNPL